MALSGSGIGAQGPLVHHSGRNGRNVNQPNTTMNRIPPLDPTTATGKSRQLLDAVQSKLGITPNLTRVLAHAPSALEGYLSFSGAVAGGGLSARVREQIALTVAEENSCGYCLSAHTFIGGKVGLTDSQIADARQASATDGKTDGILKLAANLVAKRGKISDASLESARQAGISDAEIVETVANVALNLFTNYLNHVAETVIDFPEIVPSRPCESGTCACS